MPVEKVLSVEVGRIFNAEEGNTWSAQVEAISGLIARKLKAVVEANDQHLGLIFSKRKAICTLLPHVVSLRQFRWGKILTETLHPSDFSQTVRFLARYVKPMVTALFDKPGSHLADRAVLFVSPRLPSPLGFWDNSSISKWNAIALNVSKGVSKGAVGVDVVGETAVNDIEVSESVADMLLQFASDEILRPQILAETWVWLKKPRSLPVCSWGRRVGTTDAVVRHIRGLGDIETLKSYFLLVWSEWNNLHDEGLREMEISMREDFGGAEGLRDREELIERLDWVLGQLSLGPAHFEQHLPPWIFELHNIQRAVSQYSSLKSALLEVHESVLLRTSLRVILLKKYTDFLEHLQDLT